MNKKIKTYALALLAMFLWGSAFPVVKLTYESFNILADDVANKMLIAGIRFFLAGFIVFIFMLFYKPKLVKQYKPNIKFILFLGLLNTAISYFFFYIGVGNTSGIKSSILQASSTFLTVIFAHFFLKERLNAKVSIALILGLLGIIVSNLDKGFDLSFRFTGEGFMLINGIASALATIYVKKYSKNISSFVLTSGQMMSGSLLLILVGIFASTTSLVITGKGILLLLYSAIISSSAFTIWYYLLNNNPASEISFLRLFIPIFGTLLSALILGEAISIYNLFGLIFVVCGVYLINKKKPATNSLK